VKNGYMPKIEKIGAGVKGLSPAPSFFK